MGLLVLALVLVIISTSTSTAKPEAHLQHLPPQHLKMLFCYGPGDGLGGLDGGFDGPGGFLCSGNDLPLPPPAKPVPGPPKPPPGPPKQCLKTKK